MPTRHIDWPQAWRIIASRYPIIDLFERLTPNPAIWEALIAAEQLTNPRIRDEVGAIALVPPDQRIAGPGATYVMASFTHLNPNGSRFSDGTYGVYYVASDLETAIAETVHHFANYARDANDGPRREEMRVLVGAIINDFEDVSALAEPQRHQVLDPNSYTVSQAYGRQLRDSGSLGVIYPSVRRAQGLCVGAFTPVAVRLPVVQERHLVYHWDGQRVDRYFDHEKKNWIELEPLSSASPDTPQP